MSFEKYTLLLLLLLRGRSRRRIEIELKTISRFTHDYLSVDDMRGENQNANVIFNAEFGKVREEEEQGSRLLCIKSEGCLPACLYFCLHDSNRVFVFLPTRDSESLHGNRI